MSGRPLVSTRSRGFTVATLLVAGALALSAPALAIKCASESINCGGGFAESPTFRLNDTLAESSIGSSDYGHNLNLNEGFWFTLPYDLSMAGVSAVVAEEGTPVIQWTVSSLDGVLGFNIYRATSEDGPFELVNPDLVTPTSPGSYTDTSTLPQTTYWYDVRTVNADGSENSILTSRIVVRTGGTLALRLHPLFPNPTSDTATVSFDIPDTAGDVELAVFNVNGQRVATIVDGPIESGRHERTWDGRDNFGHPVSSGIYFARLVTLGKTDNQKIMVLR